MLSYNYRCKIIRVVDGDTIDLLIDVGFKIHIKERIRVFGVDTPKTKTRNEIEKKAGIMAKEKVLELLPEGSEQVCITSRDEGKFGRYLADFAINEIVRAKYGSSFVQSTTLSQFLITNHLAVAYYGQSKNKIISQHEKNYVKLGLL